VNEKKEIETMSNSSNLPKSISSIANERREIEEFLNS
jgi:hypothetical protein